MWKNVARLKDASAKKQGFFVQTCATAEDESECENHHNDDECIEDEGWGTWMNIPVTEVQNISPVGRV